MTWRCPSSTCYRKPMPSQDSTCWTLLGDAAAGGEGPRAEFVKRYEPWSGRTWRPGGGDPGLLQELDDTAQEIFIECLRGGGVLDRARADWPGGFRAFLYGAAGMLALRVETRAGHDGAGRSEQADFEAIPSGQGFALTRLRPRLGQGCCPRGGRASGGGGR